ncbi:MAG: carotenoid 1,2-hydratase [Gemmatimonadetes bacterium]|jgi:predicted secreted hydrolase|nr:carotenoid 1,2-hydratase [Gemmatimonadota bacterium]MDA1104756.1 carotenoid 1,2-hydratase [Gemmatimonadota bacterium]
MRAHAWSAMAALLGLMGCSPVQEADTEGLSLAVTLGGTDTAGYARALEARDFRFPADHGPHPDFKTEWWYVTGHLTSESGRRFGYQLTLFRSALAPSAAASESVWSTRQAYMGHFAVSDIDGGAFYARERFARGAAGLAGATGDPLRVWLEGWSLEGTGVGDAFPLRLTASDDSVALELTLEPGKGIVLNGEDGLSQKSAEPGNASYYYSLPRMPTVGSLRVGSETFDVNGSSWLDREWSTSVLGKGQVGWDWFALQLDDDREVMVYRIRQADGSAAPESEGALVAQDGTKTRLAWESEIQVEDLGSWTSPDGRAAYPERWLIRIPSEGLELELEPLLSDQELRLTFRYWEGAVSVRGTSPGGLIKGLGYVELTGYGETGRSTGVWSR